MACQKPASQRPSCLSRREPNLLLSSSCFFSSLHDKRPAFSRLQVLQNHGPETAAAPATLESLEAGSSIQKSPVPLIAPLQRASGPTCCSVSTRETVAGAEYGLEYLKT